MQLILPKNFVEVGADSFYAKTPLFFLAGPVLGGGDWQRKMLHLINQRQEHCLVAIPCRYPEEDEIRRLHVPNYAQNVFAHQTHWERCYLRHAAQKGCIIFWLGEEDKFNPRDDGEPYARDTRGEIGAWGVHLKYVPSFRVVVGAEPGFPGLSVIKRNLDDELGYDFPIYSTMEDTVKAAVRKLYE
ncbi:MAG: hypothetical protein M0P64_03370 [Candidatus Pacebacteria bacterium]|nr:hypothetical protein [Candidatus Paceibacterota bacterium]